MNEFKVNIYIETITKGFGTKEAAGEWLVEFTTPSGRKETREGMLWRKETTDFALTLELIRDAISILTKTCSILVTTNCGYVSGNIELVPRWEKNGWIAAKGEPVKNKELWQQVYGLIRKHYHFVEFRSVAHEYQELMKYNIRKELGKIHAENLSK